MGIAPFARKGRFWRGNLHTHSTRSDGRLAPEAVADFYRDAGYDFLMLSDHFWECYGYPVTDTRALRSKTFTTLLGAEIHAPITAKNHDWHILAAGLPLGDIGMHLLFGLAVLAIGFFLFQANIIGGGDAKLLAAATVWTGFPGLPVFLFWTAITGGILALALLAARQFLKQTETRPAFVNRLLKQTGIPYGLAIMAGGLMAIPALPFAASALTSP